MNQQYLERFERSDHCIRIDGKEVGVAYLKSKYEGELLDRIFEWGEDRALAVLSPEEQIKRCRFVDGALPGKEKGDKDVKKAFRSGYEIGRPHGASIWAVLLTRGGLFLGFLIDAEYMLYVGGTVTIVDVDTTGDNNGAGYKGGEDSYSSLSLVMDPDLPLTVLPGVYMPDDAARTAAAVTLPEGIGEVGVCAFRGDTDLEEVILPEGVTRIGRRAFEGCTSLKRIVFPSTLRELEAFAFCGCQALGSITLPEGVTALPPSAFADCTSLREVVLPGVTELSGKVFIGCSALTSVTLPRLLHLGAFAFADCTSLKSITLPEGLRTLGAGCFRKCLALTSFTVPSGVTEIGDDIFFYCDGLAEVRLPAALLPALSESLECSMTTDHMGMVWDNLRIVEL